MEKEALISSLEYSECSRTMKELCERHGFFYVKGAYRGVLDEEAMKLLLPRYQYRGILLPRSQYRGSEEFVPFVTLLPHAFGYDSKSGLFFDITARQFVKSYFPRILVFEENDERLAFSEEEIRRPTTHVVKKVLKAYKGEELPREEYLPKT